MISANDNLEEFLEIGKKLLFDLKISLKSIFKEKNEIYQNYKVQELESKYQNFADIVREQQKSTGIIREFLKTIETFTDVRRSAEDILGVSILK